MEQLTVYIENHVGSLSKLLEVISDIGVNVRSVSTERGNMSEVRFILDEPERVKETLAKREISSHIVDIVVVELTDRPGELASIAEILDTEEINIEYMYGIDNDDADKGLFAIKTSASPERIREMLTDFTLY